MIGFILGTAVFSLVIGYAAYEQFRRERQVRRLRTRFGLSRRQASQFHAWLRRQAAWHQPASTDTDIARLYVERWMEEFSSRH